MKKLFLSLQHPDRILFIIIATSLILGSLIAGDFGASWDEFIRHQRGNISLNKFLGSDFEIKTIRDGSIFDIVAALWVRIIQAIFKDVEVIPILHFFYFLFFLLGVVCFYFISKRFMQAWAALLTTIFFGTQPLLLGHAFINPKDIPFMSIFLAVILIGMMMVEDLTGTTRGDQVKAAQKGTLESKSPQLLSKESSIRIRLAGKRAYALFVFWLSAFIIYIFGRPSINDLISGVMEKVYSADSSTFAGRAFLQFTENGSSIPLKAYQERAITLADQLILWFLSLSILVILFILRQRISKSLGSFWHGAVKSVSPYVKEINRQLPGKLIIAIKNKKLIFASALLGLSISLRILGPAAGGLVAFYYFFSTAKSKSIAYILAYFFVGALLPILAWPILYGSAADWSVGITDLLVNNRPNSILFNGSLHHPTELPASYLPTFLLYQFTEPLILLAFPGLIWMLFRWRRGTLAGNKIGLLTLWFFLPLLMVIIINPTMYNTIRHSLFIVPPLFIFAGSIFDLALQKIRPNWITLLLFSGLVVPGIINIYRLHPYEYIYYNQYVGGVNGAYKKYNLDYWGTSFKEAINYINETAGKDAQVFVIGPEAVSSYYLREDIDLHIIGSSEILPVLKQDTFILILAINDNEIYNFRETEVVFTVTRENAILAEVRKLK